MEDINTICANLKYFSHLRDYLQAEMSQRAFKCTEEEYKVLKLKYQHLSELTTYIENINSEENE